MAILIVAFLAVVGVVGDFFIKLSGHEPKFMDIKWFFIGSLFLSNWLYFNFSYKIDAWDNG